MENPAPGLLAAVLGATAQVATPRPRPSEQVADSAQGEFTIST